MMSNTVQAAWQTSGLPAKVEPWSPGAITAATCSRSSTAPMGSPPAWRGGLGAVRQWLKAGGAAGRGASAAPRARRAAEAGAACSGAPSHARRASGAAVHPHVPPQHARRASRPAAHPPASGLARVIMSGSTPWCWWPHSLPVRPSPTWAGGAGGRRRVNAQTGWHGAASRRQWGHQPPACPVD